MTSPQPTSTRCGLFALIDRWLINLVAPLPQFRSAWTPDEKGRWGERVVERHLLALGFYRRARRWVDPATGTDIDLVMADDTHLLFCEVKLRTSRAGDPWVEITAPDRARRLATAAGAYLAATGERQVTIRFAGFVVLSGRGGPTIECRADYINPMRVPGWRGCPMKEADRRRLV
jgi:Holliday junction resolvase-like predicted endonuclease